ncbi:endonuclease/exonuclease/phosphatase family protein [Mucilaginibacter myungsuensis]|uniref:Endonuclease/exonuclease/phosphatase family protein n=1 Tax=Mucilaginibacter myungsuensis TaxID=649104 RepID=A0A929KZ28_9SPHI|nr:endonuclease/exonuclease/phosphatase family protein [Mucilaginibacter myungsuensis]MBE9663822.1 endonuclease/exonuclease/phosphatase family protein [Mucilaginibacter myungsuensis]MDN3598463.1 endonuclease/exonuclease/phosphatase family protein [Mucilaginibacter myungsuensis]
MIIKKTGLNFFDKFVLWLNWGAVIALIIGYFAPVTDPRTFWPVAFFGLAYPPILLANALFVVYWLFRSNKWALLSAIGILAGWNILNNNIGFRMPVRTVNRSDSSVLRVMNYNVHNFKKYGENNDGSTRHEILEIIAHEQPDVIGIQEFFSRKRGEYAMIDSVKKRLKTDHYYYVPFMGTKDDGIGIAVFSKYPIVNKGILWLSGREAEGSNNCLYVDLKRPDTTLRVYTVHLQSIRFDPEDYQYLSGVSKEGKADVESSRRIGAKLKRAFLKRSEQVAEMRRKMAESPYPYIVMGDFNDTPSSYAVNQMANGLKNAFREKGSGLGRTYNGDFPNYQIDYIMASKHFDVLTYGVIRKKLSDHYPIYSDIRLRK